MDPLFRCAAQVYGPGAIGVVLTGGLDDGTARLWTIKQLGGTAIVQAAETASFPAMPRNALEHVAVDHVEVRTLPSLLSRRVRTSPEPTVPADDGRWRILDQVDLEVMIAQRALEEGARLMERVAGPPATPAEPASQTETDELLTQSRLARQQAEALRAFVRARFA